MTFKSPKLMLAPIALASCGLLGCGNDDASAPTSMAAPTPPPSASPSPPAPVTASIPRLAAGPHLGMITGFEPLNAQRAAVADSLYQEAAASGASIGRVQIDWAELETSEGVYDEQALADAFADPNLQGMNVIVLLSTLDSEGLTVPDYLGDADGLRDGLTLASDEVLSAFTDLLDWLGPQLVQRDVWAISVGNEVDSPIADGLVAQADAIAFYEAGFARWNAQVPEIAATITLTLSAIQNTPDLQTRLRDAADMVTFNYYCLGAELTVTDETQWASDLATMKDAAGTRDIFIQELGCPVGYSPQGQATSIGGSHDTQAAFFEFFTEQFATDPQLRAATMFQLYDWSPQLAASFAQPIRDEGEPVAADRFEEWLATSGFVRWDDNFERPAWQAWLDGLEQVRTAREQ